MLSKMLIRDIDLLLNQAVLLNDIWKPSIINYTMVYSHCMVQLKISILN